jgi:hypothetical protein
MMERKTDKDSKKRRSKARGWMAENGIRQRDIQRALRQRSLTQVSETMWGLRDDRRVLAHLLQIGCPARYLELPEDLLEAAA